MKNAAASAQCLATGSTQMTVGVLLFPHRGNSGQMCPPVIELSMFHWGFSVQRRQKESKFAELFVRAQNVCVRNFFEICEQLFLSHYLLFHQESGILKHIWRAKRDGNNPVPCSATQFFISEKHFGCPFKLMHWTKQISSPFVTVINDGASKE